MEKSKNAKKIVSEDGTEIYYCVNWNPNLNKGFKVLHPGSALNHSSLRALEKGLNERGYATINFDPRGTGYSSVPKNVEDYSLEKYSGDVIKIVHAEGLEKPEFIGHSLGFMPLVDYISKTQNAKSLTGICASLDFKKSAPNKFLLNLFKLFKKYPEYVLSAVSSLNHGLRGELDWFNDQSMEGGSDIDVLKTIVNVPVKKMIAIQKSFENMINWDITSRLKEIEPNLPMNLIYGSKDCMVSPDIGDKIREVYRGPGKTTIVNGTHSLPITNPKIVLEQI